LCRIGPRFGFRELWRPRTVPQHSNWSEIVHIPEENNPEKLEGNGQTQAIVDPVSWAGTGNRVIEPNPRCPDGPDPGSNAHGFPSEDIVGPARARQDPRSALLQCFPGCFSHPPGRRSEHGGREGSVTFVRPWNILPPCHVTVTLTNRLTGNRLCYFVSPGRSHEKGMSGAESLRHRGPLNFEAPDVESPGSMPKLKSV
jgi:hypothetical protein